MGPVVSSRPFSAGRASPVPEKTARETVERKRTVSYRQEEEISRSTRESVRRRREGKEKGRKCARRSEMGSAAGRGKRQRGATLF